MQAITKGSMEETSAGTK